MQKNNKFTKILAAVGTILVWLPLAAPVILGVIRLFGSRRFMLDYLMPFELFPLILLGSGLLIWTAIRAKARLKLISWSFGTAVALLVLGLVLAQVSGLASGRIEPDGIWNTIVLGLLAASTAALLSLAVGGILLMRDFSKKPWAVVFCLISHLSRAIVNIIGQDKKLSKLNRQLNKG